MMRNYLPEGTLVRITGKEGQQYVPLLKDEMSMKYDVIVDDAPTSPNMKDKTFAVLMQLMPMVVQAGVKVPPELLDYAPLPESLIQAWKKQIIPDPQAIQEQKQKQQQQEFIMAQMAMAEAEKDKADAMLKRAKSFESAAATNEKQFNAGKTLADTEKTQQEAQGQQIDNQIKKRIKKEFEIVAPSGEIYVGSVTE